MEDGIYRVVYKGICAGFVIKDERIIRIAPVLRRKIDFWKTIAKRINK